MRGRLLQYSGDPRTRPMKERVREQVFNLVGTRVQGAHALDLFAGTGALAIEAVSRGGVAAAVIERHFPTEKLIRKNAQDLGIDDVVQSIASDTFAWSRRHLATWFQQFGQQPAAIFCCPPYLLYHERGDDLLQLISDCQKLATVGSTIVVESDGQFDTNSLPDRDAWDVRPCLPAVLSLWKRDAVADE